MNDTEVEVRFLEIDKNDLIKRLHNLKAIDEGEDLLEEIIFYDQAGTFVKEFKMVRLRKTKKGIVLSYKHHHSNAVNGAKEIEFQVQDMDSAIAFLNALELEDVRIQEKKRHSFQLGKVTIDIDTWPSIPTYVELEGPDEKSLKQVAQKLGLDWKNVILENARIVIEKYYHIPVSKYKYFTFKKMGY